MTWRVASRAEAGLSDPVFMITVTLSLVQASKANQSASPAGRMFTLETDAPPRLPANPSDSAVPASSPELPDDSATMLVDIAVLKLPRAPTRVLAARTLPQ